MNFSNATQLFVTISPNLIYMKSDIEYRVKLNFCVISNLYSIVLYNPISNVNYRATSSQQHLRPPSHIAATIIGYSCVCAYLYANILCLLFAQLPILLTPRREISFGKQVKSLSRNFSKSAINCRKSRAVNILRR